MTDDSTAAGAATQSTNGQLERLSLADWRRRVSDLYVRVREIAQDEPEKAWRLWVDTRQRLFREHPQSPVPKEERGAFTARHFDYDPQLRFEVLVVPDEPQGGGSHGDGPSAAQDGVTPLAAGAPLASGVTPLGAPPPIALELPVSAGGTMSFTRIGWLDVPFPAGSRRLGLFWMAGYAGGLFLPFRDATNGSETYGAGRYLLDAAKSADLGGDTDRGTLILDFNFSFQPSCAFDPKWACPLAPPENRLDIPVSAGERLA